MSNAGFQSHQKAHPKDFVLFKIISDMIILLYHFLKMMVVLFYFIVRSISLCYNIVDAEAFLKNHDEVEFGIKINDGEINQTTLYHTPFTVELPAYFYFYMKYKYCTDWVNFGHDSLISKCERVQAHSWDFIFECESGYILYAYNYMPFGFNLSVVDPKNRTTLLEKYNSYKYKWYQPFSFDIYLESNEYFDEPILIDTLNTSNNTETYKYYYFEDIPYQYRPYSINITVNTRYFFKFGYKDFEENDDIIHKIDNNEITILHHSKPFNATIYLLASLSCNNSIPIELFNITADKNMTDKIIIEDDIPSRCRLDTYPDDSPQIQPDESSDSDIPYSVIFDGKCDKFDDIVQGCRNRSLKYPHCPFLNKAVDAYCGSDVISEISPNSSKLFIIAKDGGRYIFSSALHKMIVHMKSNNNITDPEVFFSRSDSFNNTRKVRVDIFEVDPFISYLTLENLKFNLIFYINSTTLHLISSEYIGSLYRYINTKHLILDNSSLFVDAVFDQLTYVLKNQTDRQQYQIEYTDKNFVLRYKNWNYEFYDNVILECPLSWAKSFGVMLVSHFIDIKVHDGSVTSIKPLNISLMTPDNLINKYKNTSLLEEKPKYFVNLTTSGNWTNIKDNYSVTFTSYDDNIDLHTYVNEKINVTKSPVYKYSNAGWQLAFYQPTDYRDTSLVTYIVVHEPYDDYICESQLDKLLNCRFSDCQYDSSIDYIIDSKCIQQDSLNETLKSINDITDKVIIAVADDNIKIDLTNLPRQYVVKIVGVKDLNSLYDSIYTSKQLLDDSSLYYKSIEVYGGIKEKVSYLTLSHLIFKFYGSPLNIHTLRLNCTKLGSGTEKIETNDLIVDFLSHVNLFDSYIFKVKQYGIIVPHERNDEYFNVFYRIEFNSGWHLYTKGMRDKEFTPIDQHYGYIPYSYAETVCLIAVSRNFEFYIPNDDNPATHKVNITLFSENGVYQEYAKWVPKDDNKYNVDLNISGEWKPEYNLSLTFVSFQDYVKVTSDPQITVKREEIYKFSTHQLIVPSPSPAPNPTDIPTMTPVPELVEKLFDDKVTEITDSKVINEALDKKFKYLNDYEGTKVIVVNADSFPFDRELEDDQYIKPISDSNIKYVNGNLHLVLPDNGKVTVHLNEKKDVDIKLKGKGNIEFADVNSEEGINIKNNANINGTLSITVPDKVKTVSINSIDLTKNSVIECKSKNGNDVTLTVTNIKADVHTNAKLYSVKISDSLTIPQSAKLDLKNVDVTSSNIYYNILNYEKLDPVLVGEFKDPPKTIKITSLESTDSFESKSFDFMEGTFDYGICEKWANLIDFPAGNKYKYINCHDSNNGLILAKKQKILIELLSNEKEPASGGGNGGGKSKGLPPGAIAGIVIGVIVAIAIVVVVVIIVLKKKKNNNNNSSIGEDEQNQEEV